MLETCSQRVACPSMRAACHPAERARSVAAIATHALHAPFWNVGVASAQGVRANMEDTYAVDLQLDSTTGMLAVFDGHGGGECATHCSHHLVSAVKGTAGWQQGDLPSALGQAFLTLDSQLVRDSSAPASSGTTGTVALLQGSRLVVAGVGDSKAVMMRGGRVVPMTVDHRPSAPSEEARIRSAGGFVHRGRVNACLNVSRALGDAQFKTDMCRPACEQQVSPEPDVRETHVAGANDFLLICSDGVWNSMKDCAVLRFVKQRLLAGMEPAKVCEELCEACLEPCRTAYDNVTCVLCTFTPEALAARLPQQHCCAEPAGAEPAGAESCLASCSESSVASAGSTQKMAAVAPPDGTHTRCAPPPQTVSTGEVKVTPAAAPCEAPAGQDSEVPADGVPGTGSAVKSALGDLPHHAPSAPVSDGAKAGEARGVMALGEADQLSSVPIAHKAPERSHQMPSVPIADGGNAGYTVDGPADGAPATAQPPDVQAAPASPAQASTDSHAQAAQQPAAPVSPAPAGWSPFSAQQEPFGSPKQSQVAASGLACASHAASAGAAATRNVS